ncbi:ATP-binding protein [Actinokineospora terrae]|uniref:AAA-like domain-containing protein n=1 Tax=Actinokineospora terrae TaxID=155974 RepID=A0A1H9NVM0_9PSEU|nr:ATP-binding protein [Actinokineospora terrae]SER39837.1 AAA-like domain-containing protein [Actinokineospora terrae]
MSEELREALAALRFNSAETPDDVWHTSPSHVEDLHVQARDRIGASLRDAKASTGPSPIGLVLQGRKGVGKTHLLGSVRNMVQAVHGYFFLVELNTGPTFWDDVANAMRAELHQAGDDGEAQINRFLRQACAVAGVPDDVANAVLGDAPLTPSHLRDFVASLRKVDARIAVECDDTIRALVLYASEHAHIGKAYLTGSASTEFGDWGLPTPNAASRQLVRDISRVLALTGPCVVAIDQLDTLVNMAQDATDERVTNTELHLQLALLADGMMQLRETTRRTLSIVACLPNTWKMLHSAASDSFGDRFTETPILESITDPSIGRMFVQRWLGVVYHGVGFTPPHPTWPVAPSAFDKKVWGLYTPRQLLMRVHSHAESCVHGEIRELTAFDEEKSPVVEHVVPALGHFDELDAQFDRLRRDADISAAALKQHNEDDLMPALLHAGLQSWIIEVGNDDMRWSSEILPGGDEVHATLHRTTDEQLDVTERWSFRLISSAHGNRVLKRLRSARTAAGIRQGVANRFLVVLGNGTQGWTGAVTRNEVAALVGVGGKRVEITDDDLRTFSALKTMLPQRSHRLLTWLAARKPASSSTFLREILPNSAKSPAGHQETRPPPTDERAPTPREIALGAGGEILIELESLRKHVMIIAGSGSGKTVLLRRIVEECALRGVSAIVLDPNNDLARLGDAWPGEQEGWRPGDVDTAADYLANTEVVVWTPGRESGRPLSFHPLPDFAEVSADTDEFTAALEAAVARLVPHAKVDGRTKSAERGKAVLREALRHHARAGKRDLADFVELLAELPEGISRLRTGAATAADLAETLRAAMVNDPLLGGAGTPTDPAVLLTPSSGYRARVSVISFIGLPSEEQRQGFVSQLQLEIFSWLKRNPAGDRPLGGLLVMDEAQMIAPSGSVTASTQSTILLASQARKYGLGLVLATQAPKGVHNQVTGNATTQFFGRLNNATQIAAANEIARAKGSTVADIAKLDRGEFYVTGDGIGFRRMRAPLCLSHHPPSPLRLEEVLDRARDDH